jgi:RHS repeat-associated protein
MEPQEIANADHSNQQYSITAVTTSAGAIAERYAYSAYGDPTILDASGSVLASSAINNRYSYTGREWDATVGLYHFRARWMSPKTGRFTGRDPIEYRGSEWNLFESLESSPLSSLDPTGKRCCVRVWASGGKAGHTALKCGNDYYSKWPTATSVVGAIYSPCAFNSEKEDIAHPELGSNFVDYCVKCPLNEAAIRQEWLNQLQNCTFCAVGSNCTTSVQSLLQAGTNLNDCDVSLNCKPCEKQICEDKCKGPLTPSGMNGYVSCLDKTNCNPFSPKCVVDMAKVDTGGTVF